jgi:hypothetical protein
MIGNGCNCGIGALKDARTRSQTTHRATKA